MKRKLFIFFFSTIFISTTTHTMEQSHKEAWEYKSENILVRAQTASIWEKSTQESLQQIINQAKAEKTEIIELFHLEQNLLPEHTIEFERIFSNYNKAIDIAQKTLLTLQN